MSAGETVSRQMVERDLEEAGVRSDALKLGPPMGPGLVFFDRVSADVCAALREATQGGPNCVLAVATRRNALDSAACWRLLGAGASDVLAWDPTRSPGSEIAARLERWEAVETLVSTPLVQEKLVGKSPAWRRALHAVVEVARFSESSVLISGESGTGKELMGPLIHALDARPAKRDLVILDCTTVVPTLSGSEFFGHEKGAFTGAVAAREGAFELADGGTLFLDEVGELPLPLQAELLRVIQEGMFKRVGSNTWRKTSFRLLCATNRDLLEEQAKGQFRRDLYYRIAAWTCRLPSLRERVDDIPLLVRHFLRQMRPDAGDVELDEAVTGLLLRRDYEGNVRDLRHLVAQMSNRHVGPGPLTVGDVPPEERPSCEEEVGFWRAHGFEQGIRLAVSQRVTLRDIIRSAGDVAMSAALAEENGSVQRAARRLGVTDRALQMRRAAHRGLLEAKSDT
jgi:transcriptional regulator with GAF, ATPase, and Fis domain